MERVPLGHRPPRRRVTVDLAALLAVLVGAIVWTLPHSASSAPLKVGVAPAFGQGGALVVPASEGIDNWAFGFQAAPSPDGGVVVAGYKEVLSLGPEGLPRVGFGREGIRGIGPNDGRRLEVEDVAVDDRGRIVLFGGATRPRDEVDSHGGRSPDQAAIVRLLPDGQFDPGFGGGDGVVRSTFGASTSRYGGPFVSADFGAVDGLGRPLFTLPTSHPGRTCETHEPFEQGDESRVVRLDVDGTPDPSFDGEAISKPFAAGAYNSGFELRPDGDTQVVATAGAGCPPHPLLIQRRLADGRPDSGFGPEGVRSYLRLRANAIAPDVGGRLLLLRPGPFELGGKTKTAQIERLTAAGALDRRFGDEDVASVAIPGFRSHIRGVVADARGRIYVVGTRVRSHGRFALRTGSALVAQRLTPDGRLDRSFGVDGLAAARFPGLLVIAKTAVLSGSRLVVIGAGHPAATGSNPADLVFAAFRTGN